MDGRSRFERSLLRWLIGSILGLTLGMNPGRVACAGIIGFEDVPLPGESFYNGSDGAGGFTSAGAFFNNSYTDFGGGFYAWSGWSCSNMTDTTAPGYGNQYSAITGGGASGSPNYGVAFGTDPEDVRIDLPPAAEPRSLQVTNTTYAYLAMLHGDAFSKKFGGPDGTDPDYFRLTITGWDGTDHPVGTVVFYLADYRFEDPARDYLVDTWTEVDLSPLAAASALSLELESSDVGPFGMNTPSYFAMDNLQVVPEPITIGLLGSGTLLARRRRGRG